MEYLVFLFSVILIISINSFIIKKNILPSFSGDNHQKLASIKSIPLSGGIFLFSIFCLIFYKTFLIFYFFLSLIFLIGLFSDTKIIKSAKIRLFLQSAIILIFVVFLTFKLLLQE